MSVIKKGDRVELVLTPRPRDAVALTGTWSYRGIADGEIGTVEAELGFLDDEYQVRFDFNPDAVNRVEAVHLQKVEPSEDLQDTQEMDRPIEPDPEPEQLDILKEDPKPKLIRQAEVELYATDGVTFTLDLATRRAEAYKDRKGPWMCLHSGRRFYRDDFRSGDFTIEDIAHHMSMIPRFGGALDDFYSVAQHCVNVAKFFTRRHQILLALLHDAPEGLLARDIPSPFKTDADRDLETRLFRVIWQDFGDRNIYTSLNDQHLHRVDLAIRHREAEVFMTRQAYASCSFNDHMEADSLGTYADALLKNMDLGKAWFCRGAADQWLKAYKAAIRMPKEVM